MNNFIPESIYKTFLDNMPIFCIDFLIKCEKEYLLLKRVDEPLAGLFWVPGGRLKLNENIQDFAIRVQMREIGRYFNNYKLKGFSNYFFDKKNNSRAVHTPTVLFEIDTKNKFSPVIDNTHSEFIWTDELPTLLVKNLITFEKE